MAKKKPDDLDTETTFFNMNVDGFRWYDKNKKDGYGKSKKEDVENKNKIKLSRKEYRAMVKGAFLAVAPFIIGIGLFFGAVYVLCYFWLK